MQSLAVRRSSEWLFDHRVAVGIFLLFISGFFATQIRNFNVRTHFRDLYPDQHPHTGLFQQYPRFGSPLSVLLVVQVNEGTIYKPATLAKIRQATRAMELIPGVDPDQITSIASRKLKHITATHRGIRATGLLMGPVPHTANEIAELRERVRSAAGVMGVWVSHREDAALIRAEFIPRLADYPAILTRVNDLIGMLGDEHHTVYAAGQPILTGWVYHYQEQMLTISAVTILGMILLLIFYMRNVAGIVTPIIVSAAAALWGLGIAGLLGISIDPLTLVLPMLLIARSFSHAIQACERYFEIYADTRDQREACIGSMISIFPPGILGILTDAAGLFLIALAPIPIMQKVAVVCGFWALSLIPANVLLTPIVLSFLPPPRGVSLTTVSAGRTPEEWDNGRLVTMTTRVDRGFERFLRLAARRTHGAAAWPTVWTVCAVLVVAGIAASHLEVGALGSGSSLLWPDSSYNTAVERIGNRFAGFNVFQAVVEGGGVAGVRTPEALALMQRFQRHMERDPEVRATFSISDLVVRANRLFHGGAPRWGVLPQNGADAAALLRLAMTGVSPGEFDGLVTRDFKAAVVNVWYGNRRPETVERALQRAVDFAQAENGKRDRVTLRLASGTMGLLAAVHEAIARSDLQIFLLVLATVFAFCSVAYSSYTAGLILVAPVALANLITRAIMVAMGIGLDVNTLPVAAVGVGVGIDYGIYLTNRIREEYRVREGYESAVSRALSTTGRAILLTATTVVVAMLPWYFFSGLRFQSDMGFLIASLMLVNMVFALFVVPLLLYIVQPRFIFTGGASLQEREGA